MSLMAYFFEILCIYTVYFIQYTVSSLTSDECHLLKVFYIRCTYVLSHSCDWIAEKGTHFL